MKFKWIDVKQKAFKNSQRIVARNTLLDYPDLAKLFEILTNASDIQLGAVIIQEGRPIYLYSRKLTGPQKRYTVIEKLLIIVTKTLKRFELYY